MAKTNTTPTKDYWAADRTHMANQRTLLAYVRTSFMLLASGVSLIKFLPAGEFLHWLGMILIPGSFVFLGIGIYVYIRFSRHVKSLSEAHELKEEHNK